MELIDLYCLAENSNVYVEAFSLASEETLSFDGKFASYIAIDPQKIKNTADEKYKLAHDLGHCMRGAFYNRFSQLDVIGQHEWRANVWAIKKLLPREELIAAAKRGYCEIYDLAEYFDLPEELVRKACEYYQLVS